MRKVKEYLDENFHSTESSFNERNPNGVFGEWSYPFPENIEYDVPDYEICPKTPKNIIHCICNNQTIQFRIMINGKSESIYGYLQTYDHIPRGEPDKNGYYARSTDEEVIKYIKTYKNIIDRIFKLKRIVNG